MMYQIVRCPNCRKIYSSGIYREKTGTPIARCAFCLEPFIDKSVNEWELRGAFGKIFYALFLLADVAVGGMLAAMLITLLILLPDIIFKTKFSHFMLNDASYFIYLIIICAAVNLVRIVIRETKDLKASKTRMADENYRQILKTAGLLK